MYWVVTAAGRAVAAADENDTQSSMELLERDILKVDAGGDVMTTKRRNYNIGKDGSEAKRCWSLLVKRVA